MSDQFKYEDTGDSVIFRVDEHARPLDVVRQISYILEQEWGIEIKIQGKETNFRHTGGNFGPYYHHYVCEMIDMEEEEEIPDSERELTYRERVGWFFKHYYESGMEFEILLESFKDDDLDNFPWYGDVIKFPKTQGELDEFEKQMNED